MLHQVIHRGRQWRQVGQLFCVACTSQSKLSSTAPRVEEVPATTPSSGKSRVDLENNPYFSRYADKIKHKKVNQPDAFTAGMNELEGKKQKEIDDRREMAEEMKKEAEESRLRAMKLDGIMRMDLLRENTAEEIAEIWSEYHKDKDHVFATIPADEYIAIYERSKSYPMFVYPLPRGSGYEFFMQQWHDHQVNFTPLASYQLHGENAPSCFTITHYPELIAEKNIVLMVGETDTNIMSVHEGQLLAVFMKYFYGLQSGLKFNMVRQMNNTPESFNYRDLIIEFENYKKDSAEYVQGKEDAIWS